MRDNADTTNRKGFPMTIGRTRNPWSILLLMVSVLTWCRPNEVVDALINELHCNDKFFRLDTYCTPNGIENIQRLTALTSDPAHDQSVYVEAISTSANGVKAEEIACHALSAADLFRIAMEGERFTQSVSDWILNRSPLLLESGGGVFIELLLQK